MANLSEIIARKNQNDEQWKAQKQAERENAAAMQDAGMEEISSNPDAYARYLEIQGDNPLYSAGNIALAMVQNPNITQFGTVERWKTLGRSACRKVNAERVYRFFPGSPLEKGYSLVSAYMTFPRPLAGKSKSLYCRMAVRQWKAPCPPC